MHSLTLMLMFASMDWAIKNDLPFIVTDTFSTPEEDFNLGRESATHQEGRAFDFSVRGWNAENIRAYEVFMNANFKKYGAWVSEEKPQVVVDFHGKGDNFHGHVQIHRRYFLEEWF